MKNSYRTLKRTIILRTMEVTILTIFVGAFILVFFVDGILQDGFIDAFVRALGFLHVSEPTAIRIYQLIFQQNKLLIVVIGFFILFIAIFYLTLNGLTKYIDQIGAGDPHVLTGEGPPRLAHYAAADVARTDGHGRDGEGGQRRRRSRGGRGRSGERNANEAGTAPKPTSTPEQAPRQESTAGEGGQRRRRSRGGRRRSRSGGGTPPASEA